MQAYLGGTPVTVSIPIVDADGLPIVAQSVEYRLIDQNETVLVARTAATFAEGDESVTIQIPAQHNTLAPDEFRALRVVELYILTEVGTIKSEYGYQVESDEVLVEGVNSFQSYNKAVFLSYEIPNLPGWNENTKAQRIAALIAARRNIEQLRFRYVFDAYQNLTLASVDQWNSLPADFKSAICRAQILEADFLLGGDAIGEYRRAGLMSMSVGEAKQFFRPAKAIEGAVCKRAMKELAKFVSTRVRLTRS